MTALTVAQKIANEVGIPAPSTLVTNQNQDARRLLAAINAAGRYLSRKDWNCLAVETTVSSSLTTHYGLPSDFRAMIPDTLWKTTSQERAEEALSPRIWNSNRFGYTSIGIYERTRFEYVSGAQKLVFDRTLATAEKFSYYYYSTGWVNSGNQRIASVSADGDGFFIPEDAIEADALWRFLKAIGQNYAQEKDEAREIVEIAMANDGGMPVLRAGYHGQDNFPVAVTPDTSVGL